MTQRQASLMADIFNGAVAISVAIALAGLTWRLILLASHRPPRTDVSNVIAPHPYSVDLAPIVTLAPFGNAVDGPLQMTTLPLELRGVLLAVPAEASSALIATNGGVVLPYKIGQAVPAGATIQAIAMDRVILSVGGHRELLTFPKVVIAPGAAPSVVQGLAGPPSPVTSAPSLPATTSAPSAAMPSANLLDRLGATPVDGGYRVGDTASPAIRQAGLLPGDVIRQVNGTALGNAAMDRQVLAAAARSGSVRVDLVRNNRQISITVPLH